MTRPKLRTSEMRSLERRESFLWSLSILAILGLTLVVLLTSLLKFFGLGEADTSHVGLVISVLVLCLCLIAAHRNIQRLRKRVWDTTRRVQEIALDLEALRSLSKITASINSQTDLSALLQMIAKEAVTTLRAHQSSVMLLDNRGRVLKTAATYGAHSEVVENATVRLGEGVAGWVAEHGEPRLMQGRLDPEAFRNFIPKDRGISSAMSVPLQIENMTLGVLNVSLLETERQFNENELSLIMIYANHAAVAVRNAALLRETKEKAKMQSILEGYVSPQVAEKLMGAPEDYMNVGEVRQLTVLFADIRGFTRIAHQMGPKKTRLFLNEVFTRLAEIIFDHQGTLDKFMGDSVMAVFGAPLKVEAPALKAVETARSMILAFQEILGQWGTKSGHVKSLSLGIGISTGRLFIGNVGSRQRFDYTVIGQEVNLAKRLCDRAQKGQILLSKSTRNALPSEVPLHDLGETSFKGVDLPVQLYEVVFEKP